MADRQITIDIPEAQEVLLNASRSGLPEILVVNRALRGFAHRDAFCWHLEIEIQATDLIDNGMPSPADSALMFEIGDEIDAVLRAARTGMDALNVLFLGRSTWNGQRELTYYVHDPEIAHQALETLLASRKWPRPWGYRMAEDFDWEQAGYLFRTLTIAGDTDA